MFKDLQCQYPYHGVPDWLLHQTFYNMLAQSAKIFVDAAARGTLMGKPIEATMALLEEMTSNNYHWSSERATPRRSGGKYDVDVVTFLASRVDALAQRLDRVGTSSIPGGSSASSVGVYAVYMTCGIQGHTSVDCYNGPSTIEHANAVRNFNAPPQNNQYPNAHSLSWKSTLTPLTGTPTLNLRVPYSHLGSVPVSYTHLTLPTKRIV